MVRGDRLRGLGRRIVVVPAGLTLVAAPLLAQHPPGRQASSNVRVLSHLPLGGLFTVADIEVEQELSRPYAYVARMHSAAPVGGFTVVDLRDPGRARVLYTWQIGDPDLHQGLGGMQNKYFKLRGRYYDVQSFQFTQTGPDADLGAIVFDMTALPDTARIREVGRLREPVTPSGVGGRGGFHNVFAYRHSDGRVLLFATVWSRLHANVFDMERFLAGGADQGLVGRVPIPADPAVPIGIGYHDFYVGYDPASRQDRFYGAGAGGYYVYDVSRPEQPRLLTSIVRAVGIKSVGGGGHTFTPTPDGRYVVAETEYQYAPLRVYDLNPGLDGTVGTIARPIGAWTADWKNLAHNHEMRWPYVFVSGYEDGLHVVNLMDPTNPYTVGFFDTFEGPHGRGQGAGGGSAGDVLNGAFGVDVRNADGLIVISDMATGFWALKLDGFDGWNGQAWGVPNNSSAQDWDHGPDGAPPARRLSAGWMAPSR